MRRCPWCLAGYELTLVSGLALLASTAPQSGAASIEAVLNGWSARQNLVRTIDCKWKSDRAQARAVAEANQGPASARAKTSEDATAPQTLSFSEEMRFVLDEARRSRFEFDTFVLSTVSGELIRHSGVDVLNGKDFRAFFSSGDVSFPNLHINAAQTRPGPDVRLFGLLLGLQPIKMVEELGGVNSFTLRANKVTVDDRECWVLTSPRSEIWVDPKVGYLPVRLLRKRQSDGAINRDVTIRYAEDTGLGFTPVKWNVLELSREGKALDSTAATVTSLRINDPITETEFQIEAPTGTWVNDQVTKETYLLREDGKKRAIGRDEYDGTNYDYLLATDHPTQGSKTLVIVVVLLACILVVVGVLLARRARGKGEKGA